MSRSHVAVARSLREAWFWSGILHDHAAFIYTNLAPDQEQPIHWASQLQMVLEKYHRAIASLAQKAGIAGPAGSYAESGLPADEPLKAFAGQELLTYQREAQQLIDGLLDATVSLHGFKEQMLQAKLDCDVKLGLGPGLLKHMILEAEEAYRMLSGAREAAPLSPAQESLHLHNLWLPDAAGHAAVIHDGTDPLERDVRNVAESFEQIFNGMTIKASELRTMLRVAPRMVGALRRLNREAFAQINMFRAFLVELREHLEGCDLMVTNLMPLLADHMAREEMYYMEHLQTVTDC